MPESFIAFCERLSETPFSLLIQNVAWVIPAVQTIHILAIAVVMGSVGLLDLRLLGLCARRQTVAGMANRLIPRVWLALVVLLASGSVLAIGEPVRSLANPAFQLKMLLLLTVIGLTLFVQRAAVRPGEVGGTLRLAGAVSLVLWVGIIFAGRWIAYMEEALGAL